MGRILLKEVYHRKRASLREAHHFKLDIQPSERGSSSIRARIS